MMNCSLTPVPLSKERGVITCKGGGLTLVAHCC